MLLVAAALALAIVLSLAGVLGERLFRDNHHAGDCRRAGGCFRVIGNGLGVEASGGAAKDAGESRGQCEIANGIGLHEEFLSTVGSGGCLETLLSMAERTEPNSKGHALTVRLLESQTRDWLQTSRTEEL